MKVLKINSSILGENSVSNKLTDYVIKLLEKGGVKEIETLDLDKNPVPQLSSTVLGELMSGNKTDAVNQYDKLINQVLEKDLLVLGVPMYNFTAPAGLKNYFDAIARAGATFHYEETGPVGHLKAKAIVVISRGGQYRGKNMDFQEDYLKTILGFLGVKEIKFVFVESLAMGEEAKNNSIEKAKLELDKIVNEF